MFYNNSGEGLITSRKAGILTGRNLAKALFSVIFAILMCVSANSFFYLPFSPVPVTMQVFTVLLSAVLLGRRWAAAAQIQYIIMGIAGLPVFAGFKNAAAAFSGPTAGYIAGFAAGAFAAGFIFDKYRETATAKGCAHFKVYPASKSETSLKKQIFNIAGPTALFFACMAGLAVIYSCGYIYLMGYLYLAGSSAGTIAGLALQAFKLGIAPFIISDMVKIAIILNIFHLKGDYEKN